MKRTGIFFSLAAIGLLLIASTATATTLFGPKRYDRTTGAPNIYQDSFNADVTGGKLIIRNGDGDDKHRVTSALIFLNGVQLFAPDDFKQYVPVLELPVGLAGANDLLVELRSKPGTFLTIDIVSGSGNPLPPTVSLQADPVSIKAGESSTLFWTSANALGCRIDPDIGYVPTNGEIVVSPSQTTTYTIFANGGINGSATDSVTISVKGSTRPSVSLSADPTTIECGGGTSAYMTMAGMETRSVSGCSGDYSTLTWSSTNAETCFIEPDVGYVDLNGSISVWVDETTTFTITATGPGGDVSKSVEITVIYPPPTVWAGLYPPTIMVENQSVLEWSSQVAETCIIEPGIGTVARSGSMYVSPTETTTYTITAIGPGGEASRSVTLNVEYPPPPISFQADPEIIEDGGSATLTWSSTYADTCTILPDIGKVATSGSRTVSPGTNTTYTLTAVGPGGTSTRSATVYLKPTVNFSTDQTDIRIGKPVRLSWQSTHASACVIEPGHISCEPNGTLEVFPQASTRYTITATGGGGQAVASVDVAVYNPFTININSPDDGATIQRPDVMVRGSFFNADGLETGVVVNGVKALVYQNRFVANHVPLLDAEDTIVVTVTDSTGATTTKAISLNYTPGRYITLKAHPESGLSAFETRLSIDGTFSIPSSSVMDEGPNPATYLESGVDEYTVQVDSEGFYYFMASVTDEANNTYTDLTAVLVQDRDTFDAFLKDKWAAMKAGLENRDVAAALAQIAQNKKDMYDYNFNLLIDHLPAIAAEMYGITLVGMQDARAEYELDKTQDGQHYSFYVLFVKDKDGIWRIGFF